MNDVDTQRPSAGQQSVTVWDLPVRLFHWLLVISIATSWAAAELGWMRIHFLSGYTILTLLLFRLGWGIVGSYPARFATFIRGPRAALEHLRELRLPPDRVPPVLGHNPLGGWMVVTLLLVLLAQAGSGLFTSDDIMVDGPFVDLASSAAVKTLSTTHRLLFDLILVLVATHVAVVAAYLVIRRENLIRPMITGRKTVPAGMTAEGLAKMPAARPGILSATLVFCTAAALVVLLLGTA
jgi:cytochrome b